MASEGPTWPAHLPTLPSSHFAPAAILDHSKLTSALVSPMLGAPFPQIFPQQTPPQRNYSSSLDLKYLTHHSLSYHLVLFS